MVYGHVRSGGCRSGVVDWPYSNLSCDLFGCNFPVTGRCPVTNSKSPFWSFGQEMNINNPSANRVPSPDIFDALVASAFNPIHRIMKKRERNKEIKEEKRRQK